MNSFKCGVAASAIAAVLAGAAGAQETSSSLRGVVTNDAGAPVSGAAVTVTHEPTGSITNLTTDASGRFSARGLRVGGPYSVSVSADAFAPERVEDLFLNLGDASSLAINLDATSIEQIVVTAAASSVETVAVGPSATFTLNDLQNLPAINRNINDILRVDPRLYIDEAFVDGVQCAGANSRFNSLTVDGVRQNDNFGLNSNGYPTERIPFSFDAIEQVAVELAPYDVQYGGFSACNINAVTKSGGNEFHGALFYDFTNEELRGDSLEGSSVQIDPFEETRYGLSVGGPILQDRLFFFAAYEKLDGANTFDRGPEGSGAVNEVAGFSQVDFDRIVAIANDVYDYDPGGLPRSLGNEDEKFLAKLDWDINAQHRASFTYTYNDGFNNSESDSDANEFEFANHLYERGAKLNSGVMSLYSDWTDRFSTEVRLGKLELDNRQNSLGGTTFGEFRINDDGNTIYIGGDDSRSANKLNYETTTLALKGFYDLGRHNITFGYEREATDIFNLFVQQNRGRYTFNSIDDFEAGEPARIEYQNALSGNVADAGTEWGYAINTLYAQDEWALRDDLTIVAGLRYDFYQSDDRPDENPAFLADYGFSNAQNLDDKDLLQPRFGLEWNAREDLSIRAGFGLFSGGNPNVWVSNAFSGANVRQAGLRDSDVGIAAINLFDLAYTECSDAAPVVGPGYCIPTAMFDGIANANRNFELNVVDPGFDIPADWKYSLGATWFANVPLDNFLGGEYVVNGDLLFSDGINTAIVKRLDLLESGTTAGGLIQDYASPGLDAFILTNSKVGNEAFNASFSISKDYDNGIDWTFGYAYSDAKDVNPMTSSVAFSNYTNRSYVNPNEEVLSRSNYNIEHRFTFAANFERAFFGDYLSKLGVFAQANEGLPFSYGFADPNAIHGFTPFLENPGVLLYVPTGPSDPLVTYDPAFDQAAFFAFLDDSGLSKYAGGFAPRNAFEGGWWTKIDMKLEQQFPGLRPADRSSAFLIIDNVGNLINDEWGILRENSFPRLTQVVDGSATATGFVFNEFDPGNAQPRVGEASLWSVRLGVRYEF